jgi:hypothetical protein
MTGNALSDEYNIDETKHEEKVPSHAVKINDGFKIKRHIENNGFHR